MEIDGMEARRARAAEIEAKYPQWAELFEADKQAALKLRTPTFDSHDSLFKQGFFKIGVEAYFKKTGQKLIATHGYDDY